MPIVRTIMSLAALAERAYTTFQPLFSQSTNEDALFQDPYNRDHFGSWKQQLLGGNTRDMILKRDLDNVRINNKGEVISGTLDDPYSFRVINFVKGQRMNDGVDIDHIVPLSFAYQRTAGQWTRQTCQQFANDPENLIASSSTENRKKSDSGITEYLPPKNTCNYVKQFVYICQKYNISLTMTEMQVARDICGDTIL